MKSFLQQSLCSACYLMLLLMSWCGETVGEDLRAVVVLWEKAAQSSPDSAQAYLSLGFSYLAIDATEQSAQAFQRAIELIPESPDGYYWLGRTRMVLEQYEASVSALTQAIRFAPFHAQPHADIGLAYFRLHAVEEAKMHYQMAVDLIESPRQQVKPILPLPIFDMPPLEWVDRTAPLSKAEIYYYLGVIAFEQGEFALAYAYCRKSIHLDAFGEAYFQLGLIAVRSQDGKVAQEAFLAAIDIKPSLAEAHYQLALLYSKQDRKDEANTEMERFQQIRAEERELKANRSAIIRQGNKAAPLVQLGTLHFKQKNYTQASTEYQKALWHDPTSVSAHLGLARVCVLQGDFEAALEHQQQAFKLSSQLPEVYAMHGFIQLKQAEALGSKAAYRGALQAYRKALKLRPNDAEALAQAGYIALQLSQLDEAQEVLNRWLSVGPTTETDRHNDVARVYVMLGQIAIRKGQFEEAAKHYQTAIEHDVDQTEAYYNMGFLAVRSGRLEEAIAFYQKVVERQPDMPEPYYLIGQIYRNQKKYQQAEDAYRQAIAVKPDFADAYERLAHLYGFQGKQLDEAQSLALKATQLQPQSAFYFNTLSWIYFRGKNYEAAERAIQKAIEIEPDNHLYQQGYKRIQQTKHQESLK